MLRRISILTAVVLVFSACELQAEVINSRWIGGPEGQWGDPSNWDPARVPDNSSWRTFVVTIDSNSIGIDEIEVGLQQSWTIDQLVCRGKVVIYSQPWYPLNLTMINGLINYGDLYTFRLDFTGDVTNVDSAEIELAEYISIHGNLYNEPNAIIEVTDLEMDIVDANIVNHGLIRAFPNGGLHEAIEFRNYGRIELINGGMGGRIFDNNSTGFILGCGSIRSDTLTMNKGIIYAVGGALGMPSNGSIINAGILGNKPLATLNVSSPEDVNNQGTIEVNAGGGVAFDCNMVNEPNAVIKLLGGTIAAKTITQSAGAIFEGFGGITSNVMINPNGLIELTGPTNIVGDVTVEHNAVLEISDGQTLIVGHTTNNGEIRVVNGKVVFQGGYSGSGIVQKE